MDSVWSVWSAYGARKKNPRIHGVAGSRTLRLIYLLPGPGSGSAFLNLQVAMESFEICLLWRRQQEAKRLGHFR